MRRSCCYGQGWWPWLCTLPEENHLMITFSFPLFSPIHDRVLMTLINSEHSAWCIIQNPRVRSRNIMIKILTRNCKTHSLVGHSTKDNDLTRSFDFATLIGLLKIAKNSCYLLTKCIFQVLPLLTDSFS